MIEIQEPLNMLAPEGVPQAFDWRGQHYKVVAQLDTWVAQASPPWAPVYTPNRTYFLLWCQPDLVCEVYRSESEWVMASVWEPYAGEVEVYV